MQKINIGLLIIELTICLTLLLGYRIAFGTGETDILFFGLFFLGVIVHLVWTIKVANNSKKVRLPIIAFSLLAIFILLKASVLRGSEFPWDGDIIVNHGRLKPNYDNNITYSVITSVGQKDSVFKINLPDPGNRYVTTLLVSDPECTGCNDCVIDNGKLLIPDTLKRFINDSIGNDIILLDGKSPYEIQGEPYISYSLKGQVIGVRDGRIIFYVSQWKRR